MPANQDNPGLVHLVHTAPKDIREHGKFHGGIGKTNDIKSRDGSAAHGVNIAQGVGHGYPAELIGIVDDWREEINRLHDCQVFGKLIYAGILGALHTGNEIGIGPEGEAGQRLGEVTRTYLTSSTGAVNRLGKTLLLFISHPRSL